MAGDSLLIGWWASKRDQLGLPSSELAIVLPHTILLSESALSLEPQILLHQSKWVKPLVHALVVMTVRPVSPVGTTKSSLSFDKNVVPLTGFIAVENPQVKERRS